MKSTHVIVVIALAILAVDAVLEFLAQDYWGAARTLAIVALVPLALRSKRSGGANG